jgi:uncharacterized protein DUF6920
VPPVVRRYFEAVLREGQPLIRTARLAQRGEFLLRPPRGFFPFTATEQFTARPPAFAWDARIRLAPCLCVRVRDSFLDGRGSMRATLLRVVRLASAEGTPDMAAGALHRFLAEAVWLPTALLPGPDMAWTGLDDTSARASLTVGATTVHLDFHFSTDGPVRSVFAPDRARSIADGAVPTPWQGRFWDHARHDGMLIPMSAEVEWLLPEGPQPYWRGQITRAAYEYQPAPPAAG